MHTFYHYNSSHCIFSLPPGISNTSQRMNNQIFHFALFYISSFIAIHLFLPITAHSNTSQKTFWHLPHFLSMLHYQRKSISPYLFIVLTDNL